MSTYRYEHTSPFRFDPFGPSIKTRSFSGKKMYVFNEYLANEVLNWFKGILGVQIS